MTTLAGLRRGTDRTEPADRAERTDLGGASSSGQLAWAPPRVNLLPAEVSGRRAVKAVQRRTGLAAVGVVVLVGAVWAVGNAQSAEQADRLDQVNAQVAALQAQQAEYAAAPQTQKRVEAAEAARATAMAQDVRWYEYVDGLTRALPAGAWLLSATTALGDSTTAATAAPAADATGGAVVGSVTISARTTTFEDVAAYLDALAAVPGVSNAYLTSSTLADDGTAQVITFSVTADVTETALTHRFDQGNG